MARRSTIEKLPEDVRRWLERALTESGFSGYNELESLLRERGYVISKS
ncbi:phage protein Gp27 family protein, partial [Escherichia coli]